MTSLDIFDYSLAQAMPILGRIETQYFDCETPCDKWNLRQLVNHLFYELAWVPAMVEGKTTREVGNKYDGDLLGSDLVAAWKNLATKARVAVKKAKPGDVAHLSYADKPVVDYLLEVGMDILVHSWDIDQALFCTLRIEDDIVRLLYESIMSEIDTFENSSIFGKMISSSPDDNLQIKFLALLGRPSEKWNARTKH